MNKKYYFFKYEIFHYNTFIMKSKLILSLGIVTNAYFCYNFKRMILTQINQKIIGEVTYILMVSKNNKQLYTNKMQQQKQRFGIRKLTVGVASVLLGTTIFIGNQVAHADTTNNSINNEEITAFTANNSSVAEEQTNPNSSTAINSDSQVATPPTSQTESATNVNNTVDSNAAQPAINNANNPANNSDNNISSTTKEQNDFNNNFAIKENQNHLSTTSSQSSTNEQSKITINFIDDDGYNKQDNSTSLILRTITKTGTINSSTNYSTLDDIKNFEQRNYELISDDTNGETLAFSNVENKNYNVHFRHKTEDFQGTWSPLPPVAFEMTPAELNNFKNGNPFLMSDPKYGINLSELTSDEYNAYHEELKWMQTSYNILQGNANQNDLDNISRIHFESLSWSKQQAIVSLIYLLSNSIERTSEQKENMSNIGVFDEGYSPELYLGAITRIKALFPNIFVQTANTPIKVIHDLVNDNIYIPTNTIKLNPSSYFDFRINLSPNEKVQVATAKNNSLPQVLNGQDTFTWKELSNGDLINHVSLIQYLYSYHHNNNSVYNITKDGTITLKPFNFSIEDKVELSYNPHFGYTISNSSLVNDVNSSINSGLNNYLFSNPYVDEQNRNVSQLNSIFRAAVYGSSDYMGGATVPHSVYNDFAGQIKHAGYSPLPVIIYNIISKSIKI